MLKVYDILRDCQVRKSRCRPSDYESVGRQFESALGRTTYCFFEMGVHLIRSDQTGYLRGDQTL